MFKYLNLPLTIFCTTLWYQWLSIRERHISFRVTLCVTMWAPILNYQPHPKPPGLVHPPPPICLAHFFVTHVASSAAPLKPTQQSTPPQYAPNVIPHSFTNIHINSTPLHLPPSNPSLANSNYLQHLHHTFSTYPKFPPPHKIVHHNVVLHFILHKLDHNVSPKYIRSCIF